MWLCLCVYVYVCVFRVGVGVGWKYSWHNIIGRGPYGKLAASYLSLSSLEAKISTSLFVALSWTPTTVIGLIIKKKKQPSWHSYSASSTSFCFQPFHSLGNFLSSSLSLSVCVSFSLPLSICAQKYMNLAKLPPFWRLNHVNLTIRNCINII